jgi:hypothetical protein
LIEAETPFALLKDYDLAATRALGVTRTPQAVVLDEQLRLRYRGRIDDQHRLSGSRREASRDDLGTAIEAVLAGRAPSPATTPAEGCALTAEPPPKPGKDLTFAEHVAPIVHAHCVDCHRQGGAAPFPLERFEHLAKRLDMIDEVVRERRMPPWFGGTGSTQFANHRGLSVAERGVIRSWIAGGAAAGDLEAAPDPPPPPDSAWRIGEPDLVLTQLGVEEVPATGIVDYRYVVLPKVFLEDTHVEAVEIRSDAPQVLHHANLAYFQLGEPYRAENFITGIVPGGDPMDLGEGYAVRIPKGSVLGLQVHLVTTGEPSRCRLSVGLRFPRSRVRKLLRHHQITNTRFAIPPFVEGHPVAAGKTFDAPLTAVGMFAHMHLRGRDMTFRAVHPDGMRETLLVVPAYDFDWQQSYHYPAPGRGFAAGTRIEVLAHFDNSRFNPFNPAPEKTVRFGLQTEDEMMYGFFFYTLDDEQLDLEIDPRSGAIVTR